MARGSSTKSRAKAGSASAPREDDAEHSAVKLVLLEIERRLRSGELAPGHRIVASELAAELNMSRVPVREALHMLAGEGVVDLHQNRGARVRPITSRDIVDMLQLLGALGKLGLSLAAEKMSDPKQRGTVRAVLDEIMTALENRNSQRFFHAAASFHDVINEIADNDYLHITYGHLHMDYFNRALASRLPGDHWPRFESNYRAIGKALLAGDAKETCRAYDSHMQWSLARVREQDEEIRVTPALRRPRAAR